MKFERSFTVPATPQTVLDALTDVERLATCLPGGLVDGRQRGNRFGGQFALQLGSASAPYSAIVAVPERDDDAGRALITVQGNDDQGDGTVDVTATFDVAAADAGSTVVVVVEAEMGGRLSDVDDAVAESYARNAIAQLRAGLLAGAQEPAPGAGAAAAPAEAAPVEETRAEAPTRSEPAPAPDDVPAEKSPAFGGYAEPEVREEAPAGGGEEAPAEKSPTFGGYAEPEVREEAPAAAGEEAPAEKSPAFGGDAEPEVSEEAPAEKSPTYGGAEGSTGSSPADVLPPSDRPLEAGEEPEPEEPPTAAAPPSPALDRDEPAAPDVSEPGLHAPTPPAEAPEWTDEPAEPAPPSTQAAPAAPAPPAEKAQRTESIAPPGYEERRLHRPGEDEPRRRRGGGLAGLLRRLLRRG